MMTTDQHTPYKHAAADFGEAILSMVLIVVAMLAGIAVGLMISELNEPYCPTEDSCAYEYYGPNDYDFGEVTP